MKKQPKAKKISGKGRLLNVRDATGSHSLQKPTLAATGVVGAKSESGDEPYTFSMIGSDDHYPPLDKVAHLAAMVLKGNGSREINAAVRTAISIYDCCYSWYEEKELEIAGSRIVFSKYGELGFIDFYTFEEAVKIITAQNRPERAKERLSDFMIYCWTNNGTSKRPKDIDKKLKEWLLEKNKSGFSSDEVIQLKIGYEKYFPTRRKKTLTR